MSALRKLWSWRFHKTLDNKSAPSQKVHMYEVYALPAQETVCSIAIDSGEQSDIVEHLVTLHNRSLV